MSGNDRSSFARASLRESRQPEGEFALCARERTCVRMYIRCQPPRDRPINQASFLARQSFAIIVGSEGTSSTIPLGYDLFRLRENETYARDIFLPSYGTVAIPPRYGHTRVRRFPQSTIENNRKYTFQLLWFVQISNFYASTGYVIRMLRRLDNSTRGIVFMGKYRNKIPANDFNKNEIQ